MNIVVLREKQPGEARVALMPESVKSLLGLNVSVLVESGAGLGAARTDGDYLRAGAEVTHDRTALLESADMLLCVNRPPAEDLKCLRPGSAVLGFLRPLDQPEALIPAMASNLTTFAVELIPRITRAQAMDALSSMATVVGYKAVLLAANLVPRMFPLLMTAAGTVAPAKVLVLGAGVAGLQAIATARRLGAVVEAYDVRAAAGEQVRSLGATFLEVDLGGLKTEDAGGYAVELSPEAMDRGRVLIAEHALSADVVITAAQVPGRHAPLLLTREAVNGMKRGSVVVDLSGSTGGNCELSKPDETVQIDGVTILAPLNLAATVAEQASKLYAKNLTAFTALLIKDGHLAIDLDDAVVGPACVSHGGLFINQRVMAQNAAVEAAMEKKSYVG